MRFRKQILALSRATGVIENIAMGIAAGGLVLMTIIIGWQVFGRYALNESPAWSESLALILMLYYVLLAAAVGVRQGFHLGMRIVVDNLPPAARKWAAVLALLLVAVFGGMMTLNGMYLVEYTATHLVPTLGISRAVAYWPFSIAGFLMVLFAVERIAHALLSETEIP